MAKILPSQDSVANSIRCKSDPLRAGQDVYNVRLTFIDTHTHTHTHTHAHAHTHTHVNMLKTATVRAVSATWVYRCSTW